MPIITIAPDPAKGETFAPQSFTADLSPVVPPPAPVPQPDPVNPPAPDNTPPAPIPNPQPDQIPAPVPVPAESQAWLDAKDRFDRHIQTDAARQAQFDAAYAIGTNRDPSPVYYDGPRVFQQIDEYTGHGDPKWAQATRDALTIYLNYVEPNQGKASGYWVFPEGLKMFALKNQADPLGIRCKAAVHLLSNAAAFGADWTADSSLQSWARSRETAYALMCDLCDEELGEVPHSRTSRLADLALGHIDQWITGDRTKTYYRPFMGGLTCEGLIKWHGLKGDSRVLPAVRSLIDFTMPMWDSSLQGLPYTDIDTSQPSYTGPDKSAGPNDLKISPDLNMLVAPAAAWVYSQTKVQAYKDFADNLFVGAMKRAYWGDGKHLDQQLRGAFDYLKWRQG